MVVYILSYCWVFVFFKQKTAYEMRISDWSSDVCSSDLMPAAQRGDHCGLAARLQPLDTLAQGHDFARIFVAELPGGIVPSLALGHRDVGAADAAALHAQQDFAGAGLGIGQSLDRDRSAAARKIGRAWCRESVCQYG